MTNSKKCFVLIRGLLRDARHWGEFPKLLQKKYPDALILTPDIPGSGSLYKQNSPNSIAAMTDALRAQIPANYQVHLLTISMEGMVAIDWMHRYPDAVNSAILIISSSADRLVDYRYSLTIQQSWHKNSRQHKTAGHDLPLDDPNWLITSIAQWLRDDT